MGAGEGVGIVRSMDSPGSPRRLAGVDQAFGDGVARPPRELLDQLRERLGRLDAAHPSADPDRSADQPSTYETHEADASGEVADVGEAEVLDEASGVVAASEVGDQIAGTARPPDGTAGSGGRRGPADGDGGGDGGSRSGGGDGGSRSGGGDGGDRVLDGGATPGPSPYRPWFMSGEPGSPWFIE
jgi:hypothetical protein